MGLFQEYYSISRPLTGDAKIKELALSEWGNAPTEMEKGRLYWKVESDVLNLYRDEGGASGDKICSGSINATTDACTLAAEGSFNINGTCIVEHTTGEDSSGNIIVTYAVEDDLKSVVKKLSTFLDTSSQWEGGTRFEKALREAKEELDDLLIPHIGREIITRSDGELDLTLIAKPRQLARVHAFLTASLLFENSGTFSEPDVERAKLKKRSAMELLKSKEIILDVNNDDVIDGGKRASSGIMIRG